MVALVSLHGSFSVVFAVYLNLPHSSLPPLPLQSLPVLLTFLILSDLFPASMESYTLLSKTMTCMLFAPYLQALLARPTNVGRDRFDLASNQCMGALASSQINGKNMAFCSLKYMGCALHDSAQSVIACDVGLPLPSPLTFRWHHASSVTLAIHTQTAACAKRSGRVTRFSTLHCLTDANEFATFYHASWSSLSSMRGPALSS